MRAPSEAGFGAHFSYFSIPRGLLQGKTVEILFFV